MTVPVKPIVFFPVDFTMAEPVKPVVLCSTFFMTVPVKPMFLYNARCNDTPSQANGFIHCHICFAKP